MKALLMLVALPVTSAADFQGILDHMRSEQAVPGAAAVVVSGGTAQFLGASGLADLETGRQVTADTRFYIGSLSKVLTAALVLDLVANGAVVLDDPVPSIPADVVRVRDLLAHASGLEREGDFGYWYSGRFPSSEALRTYLADAELRFEPGTEGHYSNVGYAALGLELERALGKPYPALLADRLLAPLGMT
ncbi:MAG: serine hydrolase domain-containing protein, partial [Woeseiaceae bacterium]|nr:serine hydrolase domain-containing protein [Woeseiaceae bacterium]